MLNSVMADVEPHFEATAVVTILGPPAPLCHAFEAMRPSADRVSKVAQTVRIGQYQGS